MFRIGEFSKIARVTTRQLRYYDECGLLPPAHIDEETGYRYYSVSQLPRLNKILALKDLGLSLDQIARTLNNEISSDELRGMLAMKKAQLEQVVKDELLRIYQIENRIEQLNEDGSLRDFDVVVQNIPEQRILSVRMQFASFEEGLAMVYEINHLLPMRAGRTALGNIIVVMHSDEYMDANLDAEIGFQVKHEIVDEIQLANGLLLTLSTLPAVEQMATVVRKGLFSQNISCYASLGSWMETNGYQIAGTGREVIMPPFVAGNESEIFIETQIPVSLVDTPSLSS